jgi:hypothetical protein
MEYLESLFVNLKKESGDINEHLETLKNIASECNTVIEFGVRCMVSIFSFATSGCKNLLAYDINHPAGFDKYKFDQLEMYCKKYRINFQFFQKDVLLLETIPECDLLFLDTIGTYFQCKCELTLFSKKVKKYIIIHDTDLYAEKDELSVSKEEWIGKYNSNEIIKSIIKLDNNSSGLNKAIDEFLQSNKNWKLYRKYKNNNGLTILKKN